jgi:hypothetical protein
MVVENAHGRSSGHCQIQNRGSGALALSTPNSQCRSGSEDSLIVCFVLLTAFQVSDGVIDDIFVNAVPSFSQAGN